MPKQRPRDECRQELRKSPEDRKYCEKILMGSWKEFEKNRRVDRQVPSNANTPESRKAANCCKVGRTGCDEAKDRCNADGKVECQSTAEEVACSGQP